ncbi:MAG: DUF6443 domain-containing protein [Bacteroidia bacterium]|nr:DUF6443 domain-containing protein [Bacteroidia bacterium]
MKQRNILLIATVCLWTAFTAAQTKNYVIINEVMYDTPLNERIAQGISYSNGEYIELYNVGITAVNLTGWYLKGEGSTEIYNFPAGTQLQPGGYLIVAYQYLNSNFTLDSLYQGFETLHNRQVLYQRKIILSNSGEALKLVDNTGATKDSLYIDGTINLRKPNRLSAPNPDGAVGSTCVSLQRKTAVFDDNGNAITNNQEWITATVNPYLLYAGFVVPYMQPDFIDTEVMLTSGTNYIVTVSPLDATHEVKIDNSSISVADGAGALVTIQYFDGLGRPVQTVLKGASPLKRDLVALQEYDAVGRQSNTWLPIPIGGTGAYVEPTSLKSAANSFYADGAAYSNPVYEPSPLNRVVEQYAPGAAWRTAGRSVKTTHLANGAGELACRLYKIATDNISLLTTGLYANNELFVTKTTDEDLKISYTFTDKLGQTVLQRVMDGTPHDTYFVYDDFGNLRYVLPPAAADALSAANIPWSFTNNQIIKDYAYYYQYDGRNNCILKKLPGCEPINMKYDKADRLIFSQDGNQAGNRWTFFFYDVFGRQTTTGIWKSNTIPALGNLVVKTDYTGTGSLAGHAVNLSLPAVDLMTVNYYDDYLFVNTLTAAEKTKMPYIAIPGYDAQYKSSAKGLLTGTRTYQMNDATKYVVSAHYYDHRGRLVQSHTSNHLGGFEDEYFAYTFTGKVKQRQHVHSATGKTTQTEIYTYAYDHAERLLSVTHKLNAAAAVTLATNTYDEVGRLKTKKLATETATYAYNVRSWLTQITGTKFNQTLTYNAAVNGVTPTTVAYNGNISAMKWKAGNETTERGYQFTLDALNRLTFAYYGEGTALTANPNRYNELVTYDKMGNIRTLQRQGKTDTGFGLIDNLTYNTYDGNKVTKITDAVTPGPLYAGAFHFMDGANVAVEYTYDANGNLKKDYNKKIVDIQYNSLNLPNGLQFTNGNTTNYVYNAAGQKLSVTHQTAMAGVVIPMTNVMTPLAPAQISTTFKTDYCGNVVYENGAVSKILTEEGYITFLSNNTPVYHYYLKDHQGNNRVVINQAGTVEQVNHYYPFGGLMGESTAGGVQPYKYNGKELDRMHGLDLFDYGARHYDAAIGRWWTVDPLAEKYYGMSPYVYTANNPVRFIDPNGMWYGDPPSNWLIPTFPKSTYGNNLLMNGVTFVNNVSADILNSGISIINTPVNAAQTLYKEGVSGLVNSEITGLKNTGNAIANEVNYTFTTPIGEQLRGFNDPATWEASAAFGATLFVGSAVANLGKGASVANTGKNVSMSTTKGEVTVYRVFGGDARAQGFSWTTKNPTSVKDFRNAAGLPSGGASGATNTADFMIKGKVNSSNIIQSRSALPLDGNKGGLPELIIDPKNVRLTDFKVLTP